MEKFGFIFLVAGIGFFALAFGYSAYLPMIPVDDLEMQEIEQLAAEPPVDYTLFKEDYPQELRKAFYDSTDEQVLSKLQSDYPDVFETVFALESDSDRLTALQASFPDAYTALCGDQSIEDVVGAIDFGDIDRDELVAKLEADFPNAHTATFGEGIPSALAQLHASYAVKLLEIRSQDVQAYDLFFEGRTDSEVLAEALQRGQRVYIGEACWHCHSQQIRPWGRDEARYGQISYPEEYHNALNKPPIWGTRRIGPDLIRRGGKQSNDWHVAHFYNPRLTTPVSVMPQYPWFYEEDGHTLNRKGISILLYVQWLGSWQNSLDENVHSMGELNRSFETPESIIPGQAGTQQEAAPGDTTVEPVEDDTPIEDGGDGFGDDGFGSTDDDGFGGDEFGGDDMGGDDAGSDDDGDFGGGGFDDGF